MSGRPLLWPLQGSCEVQTAEDGVLNKPTFGAIAKGMALSDADKERNARAARQMHSVQNTIKADEAVGINTRFPDLGFPAVCLAVKVRLFRFLGPMHSNLFFEDIFVNWNSQGSSLRCGYTVNGAHNTSSVPSNIMTKFAKEVQDIPCMLGDAAVQTMAARVMMHIEERILGR